MLTDYLVWNLIVHSTRPVGMLDESCTHICNETPVIEDGPIRKNMYQLIYYTDVRVNIVESK